jgi:hypothetical protein
MSNDFRERGNMDNAEKIFTSEIEFVNLTGHSIRLGDGLVIPRMNKPARVLNGRIPDGSVVIEPTDEILPIYRFESRGQIVGLPDPRPGVIYIVSAMVRRELTQLGLDRPDVFSPYAIESRQYQGKIVSCATALAR